MTTLRSSSFAIFFGLLVAAAGTGCAAPTDDADESSAAVSRNPEYDAAMRAGVKMTTTTPAGLSARTRVIGYQEGGTAATMVEQLLSFGRWPEMRDVNGEKVFTRVVMGAARQEGGKTLRDGKLELEGGVDLKVRLTEERIAGGTKFSFTTTSDCKKFPVGTIIKAGQLDIEMKVVAYEDGVIFDGVAEAKLEKFESNASALTESLRSVFGWLAPAK